MEAARKPSDWEAVTGGPVRNLEYLIVSLAEVTVVTVGYWLNTWLILAVRLKRRNLYVELCETLAVRMAKASSVQLVEAILMVLAN